MPRTITIDDELESILVDQALAMARQIQAVSDAAPDGQVLALAEVAALRSGRELTRVAPQAAPQHQTAAAATKDRRDDPAPAAATDRPKTRPNRRS